jgi:hypothetical protein
MAQLAGRKDHDHAQTHADPLRFCERLQNGEAAGLTAKALPLQSGVALCGKPPFARNAL